MGTIFIMDPFRPSDADWIGAGDPSVCYASTPTPQQLAEAEVIFGAPTMAQLAQASQLRWLQIPWAGTDGYTQQPGFPDGVMLTNATGAFGQSISEFVLAVTLMLMKGLHRYRDNQSHALWQDEGVQQTPAGKRILILGAGDIGTHCASLFRPFGCHITGVRRVVRELPPEFDEMLTLAEVEERLSEFDVVICALPNTPSTRGWFDRRRLEKLSPNAYLINVGRGNLICCDALAQLLAEGKMAGAALDVTDPEPLPQDHPLWSAPNAIVTPHITGGSFGHLAETTEQILQLCRENLCRYRQGRELQNRVNFETGYTVTRG